MTQYQCRKKMFKGVVVRKWLKEWIQLKMFERDAQFFLLLQVAAIHKSSRDSVCRNRIQQNFQNLTYNHLKWIPIFRTRYSVFFYNLRLLKSYICDNLQTTLNINLIKQTLNKRSMGHSAYMRKSSQGDWIFAFFP